MGKSNKITLWVFCGVLSMLLITLCVLLSLGFRFSPEAAVHELYRNNTHIHTDEYDFFLHDVKDETGEPSYADGHTAVKRYGFLYKEIKSEDKISNPLVAENGESVGEIYSYEGTSQTYRFIHWTNYPCPDELLPEVDVDEDVATAVMYVKYRSKNIICNGETTELFNYCYFVTDESIETLVIKDTDVYVVNGLRKGDYWNDDSVFVVSAESDIDAEQIKAHYDNGGIIVVRNWQLADDVEGLLKATVSTSYTDEDLAIIFYKTEGGSTGSGCIQGNTTDLESEIDDMVARAKERQ